MSAHRLYAPTRRSFRLAVTLAAGMAVLAAGLAHASVSEEPGADRLGESQPNVVMVLVDDMSENLYPYMSELTKLSQQGVTFTNYFNATPWCCPSRATMQSGKYPHNTGVFSNGWPNGGFERFMVNEMDTAVGVQMQTAGYRTGFMGKYLNGYKIGGQGRPAQKPDYSANFVPPGWDSWFAGNAYQHFQWQMVVDESDDDAAAASMLVKGRNPATYYTDVLADRAEEFIADESGDPFLLVLTPFAPHSLIGKDPEGGRIRYPAAPRDRADSPTRPAVWGEPEITGGDCGPMACADVPWPDTTTPENFNQVPVNPLSWMASTQLTPKQMQMARASHIQRIQMLQSVNDLLRDVRLALEVSGDADNTYIMFGSDNGYHLGEHALAAGKTTAYDHDLKTPLVVLPPGGLETGVISTALVQNTDLLPTMVEIAGAVVPADVDGASLVPLLAQPDLPWRQNVLMEIINDDAQDGVGYRNPDLQGLEGRVHAPTYNAMRSMTSLYVDYSLMDAVPPGDHEAEYYDLTTDPAQMINIYASLPIERKLELNAMLLLQTSCQGQVCRDLQGLVPVPPPTTEPPTEEPTTEPPTEEPTTEPPTEEPTEPPTEEPTTEPPTEEPTEPPTEEPTTEPPTEEPTTEPGG